MLRNRSRSLTAKQSLMADQNSVSSPRSNQTTPISSFFGSPRFFNGFFTKGSISICDSESVMSPTSILDSKNVSSFGNPFGNDQNLSKSPQKSSTEDKHFNEELVSEKIGLALIDSLNDEKIGDNNFNSTKEQSRKVLFGSYLKIQIPTLPESAIAPTQSPKSPADFGINTRKKNLQFLGNSSPFGAPNSGVLTEDSPKILTRGLSLREMELSEDYTCVISHGPNPRTTHIYDNCIVDCCCGVVALTDLEKEHDLNSPSQSYLSFCHTCKKNLGDGKDINMYRGEKPFRSTECRCQEMLLDDMKKSKIDNGF